MEYRDVWVDNIMNMCGISRVMESELPGKRRISQPYLVVSELFVGQMIVGSGRCEASGKVLRASRSLDAEFLHTSPQSVRVKIKDLSRSAGTFDSPAGLLKCFRYVFPLCLSEGLRFS